MPITKRKAAGGRAGKKTVKPASKLKSKLPIKRSIPAAAVQQQQQQAAAGGNSGKGTQGVAATGSAPAATEVPISPVTGLPTRTKVHLPIKGFGRLNAFQVLENLYGHSAQDLKRILEYEERHQNRRMVIDRINDLLRRIK
jgi:hypothetical protein